jgi:hypothetical protein
MPWFAVAVIDLPFRDPNPRDHVWTVSKNKDMPGWDTDSGCDGYGLTRVEADFLAAAANEKEARDGVEGPWTPNRPRVS